VSDATKDDLIKLGIKKPIFVIPNAIEFSEFLPRKINPYQFIFVGRLVFYKNLEVVIRAIDIVRKKQSKIKLIIVGGGPHKKSLVKLTSKLKLEKNVEFKGYVSSEEKLKLMGESTALVFPSLLEGFGIVILESFSQKRPVLVSNVRPLSDIVSSKTGYVLDPHNEVEWANAMLEFIENPDIVNSMGSKGFKELDEKYSLQKMYERIFSMYEDVAKK